MRSIKDECLEGMIFFGQKSLRHAIREYLAPYHGERNHQGLANRILVPGEEVGRASGEIESRERLGGLLRYYYRKAARRPIPLTRPTMAASWPSPEPGLGDALLIRG